MRFPIALLCLVLAVACSAQPIDREALVRRHNVVVKSVDYDSPLTVGNGGFAFTADITGLQTFSDLYHRNGIPTETQARWAWVTDENPNNYTLKDASKPFRQGDGRVVDYPVLQNSPAGDWLRKNPRPIPVGQLQLVWDKPDGTPFTPADIQDPEQVLDLWTGTITSKYKLGGVPVTVITAAHPRQDAVAVKISSPLVGKGTLGVRLAFPRGHDLNTKNTPALDWSRPESHQTKYVGYRRISAGRRAEGEFMETDIARKIGPFMYLVSLGWEGGGRPRQPSTHVFEFRSAADGSETLTFAAAFSRQIGHAPSSAEVSRESATYWPIFWQTHAVVDFSGSTNPLAAKMEKRIVLSRYLMAVQNIGEVPPQESGLTCNTWYGKHHTEMIWWNTGHFALWGQEDALAKNLDWFVRQLPAARELAASRGLKGARWAKMTGHEMRESPGGNPMIIWNQPHPIFLAELIYRAQPTPKTLARYRALVFETAECLATMAWWDEGKKQYNLGPPLWIAQEIYDQATSQNPSYELAYWRHTLEVAQTWRERLGMKRDEKWDHVINHLAPLPQKDGKYVALASHPDTWDNIDSRHDHPTMLAPLGILPGGPMVDRATMERTLDAVLAHWDWKTKIWGWDYPMIAMTAARLGRPEVAVEILLRDGPNNIYLPNGHAPVRSDEKFDPNSPPGARKREIAVYLPANGSFLSAVALMVAGWDGNTTEFPGIPKDGTWKVRAEGLRRMP
jgi:hypothetical protein